MVKALYSYIVPPRRFFQETTNDTTDTFCIDSINDCYGTASPDDVVYVIAIAIVAAQ